MSNDLTQMVNYPIQIPGCVSHSPDLLEFVLQWLSLNWEIMIMLLSQCQTHNGMHCFIAYAYGFSHADWDGLCGHLRDIPWEDIFKHNFCCC